MKAIRVIVLIAAVLFSTDYFGQHGRGHRGRRHGRVVVVKRSPYRPTKVIVYHPYWRPNYAYNRRWVFFPRYNIYWDNWRNHYVYLNGAAWVSQPTPPPVIVNVNLDNEKTVELPEDQDDVDDVYQNNAAHKPQ